MSEEPRRDRADNPDPPNHPLNSAAVKIRRFCESRLRPRQPALLMAPAGVLAVVFVMHWGRGAVPVRWRVVSAAAARISFVVCAGGDHHDVRGALDLHRRGVDALGHEAQLGGSDCRTARLAAAGSGACSRSRWTRTGCRAALFAGCCFMSRCDRTAPRTAWPRLVPTAVAGGGRPRDAVVGSSAAGAGSVVSTSPRQA
jgi:hypothetical protein